jgi:uncharacterized membrane protein (DUF4010 family)
VDEYFDLDLALRLAAAVGLGLLMGLERERAQLGEEARFGGVRTFPLIALSGAAAAYAAAAMELPGLSAVVFAAVAALVVVSYLASSRQGEVGITTEVGALLSFVLGVLCLHGHVSVATAIGVIAVLLLALKDTLHAVARRIEAPDIEATLRFALITAIVLPLLPNQTYGPPPFDALNPYEIWLMVVLIAGFNFAGYLLVKWLGAEHGLGLTGLLGGLVSSTALTLGFAQRSRDHPGEGRALALGILLAWSVMFARVIAEVAVVNRALVARILPALGALLLVALAVTLWLQRKRARSAGRASVATRANPLELRMAIQFGLLYAAIALGSRAAGLYFGDAGLYAAGALAGISDVDAITLSMANLAAERPESADVAARTIAIAAVSNTLAKSGIVLALGAASLRRTMLPIAAALAATGLAAIWLAL